MKKILAIGLAFVVILCGCGRQDHGETMPADETTLCVEATPANETTFGVETTPTCETMMDSHGNVIYHGKGEISQDDFIYVQPVYVEIPEEQTEEIPADSE